LLFHPFKVRGFRNDLIFFVRFADILRSRLNYRCRSPRHATQVIKIPVVRMALASPAKGESTHTLPNASDDGGDANAGRIRALEDPHSSLGRDMSALVKGDCGATPSYSFIEGADMHEPADRGLLEPTGY
jgi:hypothetical protein